MYKTLECFFGFEKKKSKILNMNKANQDHIEAKLINDRANHIKL